jgi:hypothetical protein
MLSSNERYRAVARLCPLADVAELGVAVTTQAICFLFVTFGGPPQRRDDLVDLNVVPYAPLRAT